MSNKVKITVIKKFTPDDVFGPDHGIAYNGGEIPACPLEIGSEFIVDHSYCNFELLLNRLSAVVYCRP